MSSRTRRKRKSLFARVFERDGGRCFWCDRVVTLYVQVDGETVPGTTATLDHIIPQSKDGWSTLDNLLLACRRCNSLRGNLGVDAFLDLIESDDSPIPELRIGDDPGASEARAPAGTSHFRSLTGAGPSIPDARHD